MAIFPTQCMKVGRRYKVALYGTLAGTLLVPMIASAAIPGAERQALIDLYNQTGGGAWTSNSNWCSGTCPTSGIPTFNSSGSECQWYGVTCDAAQGHVVEIELSANNLGGVLPGLGGLASLRYFAVTSNHVSGSLPALTSMAQLRAFYVDGNQFSGAIPTLAGLVNLEDFSADGNQLSGGVPSLSGLGGLFRFSAARNQLTGTIPALDGLAQLRVLDLSHNRLTGSIPGLTGLPNLLQLELGDNRLTGSLPALAGSPLLHSVDFGANRLSGAVPAAPVSLYTPLILQPSVLCPNALTIVAGSNDAGWSAATGYAPWWAVPFPSNRCDGIFVGTFEP